MSLVPQSSFTYCLAPVVVRFANLSTPLLMSKRQFLLLCPDESWHCSDLFSQIAKLLPDELRLTRGHCESQSPSALKKKKKKIFLLTYLFKADDYQLDSAVYARACAGGWPNCHNSWHGVDAIWPRHRPTGVIFHHLYFCSSFFFFFFFSSSAAAVCVRTIGYR